MTTLLTLLFQGDVAAEQPLAPTDEREVVHSAFPMTPPRDATTREDFRAWKIVPLTSGRLLLSTVANRGDEDDYGRPVLRANGCLLASGEMAGALRDPTAIWQALDVAGQPMELEAFMRRVEASSIHSSPEAFERFSTELGHDGAFHARAASVLGEETADLYFGDVAGALEMVQPTFGLLSRGRLERLHLSIGGEFSDAREPILGLPGGAPDDWRGGLLSSLFGRKNDDMSAAAVDFETREIFGTRAEGPIALAEAIADPQPWPLGLDGSDRYRMLLDCLDAGKTPFDVVPKLEELRQTIERIGKLSKSLRR